jgi:flagellar basal-body rod protein FlgC
MSTSAISTGMSGLQAFQRALDISANNVANTLTAGYKARQANFSESAPSGTGATVSASLGSDGTSLETEMVGQLTYQAGFQASAKLVKASDDMLGSLIDTKA